MKKLRLLSLGLLILTTTMLSSCKKEGCTDKDSTTYDEKAKKDDGSCTYEGQVVFWWDQSTSTYFMNQGVTTLHFLLDGVEVGTAPASSFWASAPACGSAGSVTIKKALGGAKNKTFLYDVEDQNGQAWDFDFVTFSANQCVDAEVE